MLLQKHSLLLVLVASIALVLAFTACAQGRSVFSLAEQAMQMQREMKNVKRDHTEGGIHVCLETVAAGLNFATSIENAGDGTNRLFVTLKEGQIAIFDGTQILGSYFLDITDRVNSTGGEQGLLGLAFHPNYTGNGYFYVQYTHTDGENVVERFSVMEGSPNQADPSTDLRIITTKPATEFNNGGQLIFGPDGYLYIAVGDGEDGANAQDQTADNFMGKILRIDVDEDDFPGDPDKNYGIPSSNPLSTEIWASGLRNPWRNSFDKETGDLYIVDVGEESYEEINFQAAAGGGNNYGWPYVEGYTCVAEDENYCDGPLTAPIAGYAHGDASCVAIIGGYVYRGEEEATDYPEMVGKYFYADFCSGELWVAYRVEDDEDGEPWQNGHESVDIVGDCSGGDAPSLSVVSFAEDENGELYLLGYSGQLVRIRGSDPSGPPSDDDAASSLFSIFSFLF